MQEGYNSISLGPISFVRVGAEKNSASEANREGLGKRKGWCHSFLSPVPHSACFARRIFFFRATPHQGALTQTTIVCITT